ncbi:GNAT family N-acetyltransferase [Arhodomonas sp. AD133]|uniref:GNAT family N-acetyltransferase n=1 Tax=Arhodomonas sp. AD133 TaxID=3415009 RepID=UPI003EBEFB76
MIDAPALLPYDGRREVGLRSLYETVFPAWEREPTEQVLARLASGRYGGDVLLDAGGGVIGFAIVDFVTEVRAAVVTFVAVAGDWRGRGLGERLVLAAVARFRRDERADGLYVEAEPRPARLYRRCGFRPLALDYRVPHYDCAMGTQPMSLMFLPRGEWPANVPGTRAAALVRHMFIDGYGVRADDPRLAAQCRRIPYQVRVSDAELSPDQ